VISPSASSYLTVFPADAPKPLAANVNWRAGDPPVSNAVTTRLSGDGRLALYNFAGIVDVAVDLVGYYADHTHDDRYAGKNVSLVYDGFGMDSQTNNALTSKFGCARPSGVIPLDLPVGATLRSVTAMTFDAAGPGTYSVQVRRYTDETVGYGRSSAVIGTVSGGSREVQNVLLRLDFAGQTVAPGMSYVLEFGNTGNNFSENALCSVQAEVTLP
jgi:hypothetical protein